MKKFHAHQTVKWKWGSGQGSGVINKIYKDSVSLKLQGKKITRKGTEENPAYLIVQKNKHRVLKLQSELKT